MTALANPAHFILAGNATFTLVSKTTGTRYTYRVRQAENNATMHFVALLSGPDNTSDYRYLGFIRRGVYFHGGAKAKVGAEAPSAKAFDWFYRILAAGRTPSTVEVHHENKCGKCGRPLTVPESIKSGYGPDCITRL